VEEGGFLTAEKLQNLVFLLGYMLSSDNDYRADHFLSQWKERQHNFNEISSERLSGTP